jgi:hypothetical protein
VGKEAGLLDDVPEPPPQRDRILAAHVASENDYVPRVVIEEPVDELQRGRLSATGRPDERQRLPLGQREREPVEDGPSAAERFADVAEFDDGSSQFSVLSCQLSADG